jgi:hypothetical protein
VKIQFAEERMHLLNGLHLGKHATVGFTVCDVNYYWQGGTKYLVVLMGQQVEITPAPSRRKKSSGQRRPGLGSIATDFWTPQLQFLFPRVMPLATNHHSESAVFLLLLTP